MSVGCPVSNRAWIINEYVDFTVRSCEKAGVEPAFFFLGSEDDPTRDKLDGVDHTWIVFDEPVREDKRVWCHVRYNHMVDIRNALLDAVDACSPELFLSLDSDILCHEDQVSVLLSHMDRFDVVGGKAFMSTTGVRYPSYAKLTNGSRLHRADSKGVFPVDVVMAIKMMSPEVVSQVRYKFDRKGEDIGFSLNARDAGFKLGWTGEVCSKHIMKPEMLGKKDARCGF